MYVRPSGNNQADRYGMSDGYYGDFVQVMPRYPTYFRMTQSRYISASMRYFKYNFCCVDQPFTNYNIK